MVQLITTLTLCCCALGQRSSFNFQFVQFSQDRSNLTLLGDASVAQNDLALELTINASGRALYRNPIRFKTPSTLASVSFMTTFIFSIETGINKDNEGEGLAFLIVPDNVTMGSGGAWMGLLSPAAGTSFAAPNTEAKMVAVEFDVQQDVEFWDISNNHVGVNVNTLNSVVAREAASGSQGVSLVEGHVKTWIEYDGEGRKMQVTLAPYSPTGGYQKPDVPLLAVDLDLSGIVNEYMYVGFSAATRSGTAQHKVWSWTFESSAGSIREAGGLNGYEGLAPTPSHVDSSQPENGSANSRIRQPGLGFASWTATMLYVLLMAAG